MRSRGIIIFEIAILRFADATLAKKHNVFSLERFTLNNFAKMFFNRQITVDVCMIKSIDTEFQTKINRFFFLLGG